jgi:ARG/rhodanese/phosphatase superfamily protein
MRRFILVACVIVFATWASSHLRAQKKAEISPRSAGAGGVGTPYGDYVVGKPVVHENLAIFPITSKTPKNQDRYTTLDESLAAGTVKVIEIGAEQGRVEAAANQANQQPRQSSGRQSNRRGRANESSSSNYVQAPDLFGGSEVAGDVNKLMVENKSGKPLYLMPGEVISGGKQDRTIGQEMVIAPNDKAVPIDVFCVEHGRWAGRSAATTTSQFGSAESNANLSLVVSGTAAVPELAKQAEQGQFIASVGQLNKDSRLAVQHSAEQGKVWEEVAKTNSKTGNRSGSGNFAANYFSGDIAKDFEPFIKKLKPVGDTKQIVGVAVAVNGKMLSVDIFESTPLFKKFWPKLLKSYALDAVAAKSEKDAAKKATAIAVSDCIKFLKEVENSKTETQKLAGGQKIYKRDSKSGTSFSYHDSRAGSAAAAAQPAAAPSKDAGGFGGGVHTSVLAK